MRYGFLCFHLLLVSTVGATPPSESLFVRRIGPLLQTKCLGCHGKDPDNIEGSLDLRTAEGILVGGDSGVRLVDPTDLPNSPLLLAVHRESDDWSPMPPKEAERLTEEELGWMRQWVEGGAEWPDPRRQAEIQAAQQSAWDAELGIPVATSGGLDNDWTHRRYQPDALWAYRAVKKPEIPSGKNPIDWLLSQRTPEGLPLAPRADRKTLLRRAVFDLTGLPPTPKQLITFLADARPDKTAFADVIEALLASPHYGERMAQHWLDVTRYADSSGLANDYERGNAWRYRDYVVRAFNNDKPYNQFIVEQIAGDEVDPENPEAIVATGFLRMGPWELTGMEVAKVARQRFLDDVTNGIGEVFLAHSLQCARCHDHKFDPVPTRDYYSIQAVFATTQLAERKADFLPEENTEGFDEVRYLHKKRDAYNNSLNELDRVLLDNAQTWFQRQGLPPDDWDAEVQKAKQKNANRVFNAARSAMARKGFAEDKYPPKLVGFTPAQFGMERVARKGLQRLSWELERYQPFALSVYNGHTPSEKSISAPKRIPEDRQAGERETTCILTGGDPFRPATPVQPGALSVLKDLPPLVVDGSQLDGKRTALANWIASPNNCLTTRTIANRIWMWHFGRPIAGNPNNFGSTGKRPTHPELLDWLAVTLVNDGWSLKSLHRRIMNSDAYARSSQHPNAKLLDAKDPKSVSYARFLPRRLSAEEMRDAMLLISGELNLTVGGIPCRPEINIEVALQPRQVMGSFASAWVPNPRPEDRHRRSLYTLKLRGLLDPMMEVFNAPSPDFSCEFRNTSTVTPQVFSQFNGHFPHARALALAHRVRRQTTNDVEAIRSLFQRAYARHPSQRELEACTAHLQSIQLHLKGQAAAGPTHVPLEIERQAVEENTGEQFSFIEKLYAYEDYVADLQPGQVDAETRALADLCLVVLNSNEFVYVD